MTKAEQETTIRWDEEEQIAHLYTAVAGQARRWTKQGYPVEVADRDAGGTPRGWWCSVPKEAIRFRRVRDGQVVKRRTGAGRQFRTIDGASEHRAAPSKTQRPGTARPVEKRAINRGQRGNND